MNQKKKLFPEYAFLIAVLAAGILFRLFHLIQYSKLPAFYHIIGPDISEYWEDALSLASGGQTVSVIHAPLYVYFLSFLIKLTNYSVFAVRLIQASLTLFAGILLWDMLKRRFPRESGNQQYIPHFFIILYALFPSFTAMQTEFFAENLCLILIPAALFCYDTMDKRPLLFACLAGMCCGLAVLTHPMCLFFGFILGISLVLQKESNENKSFINQYKQFLLFGFTASIIVLSFVIPKSISSGCFIPVQEGGDFNFWLGNHVGGKVIPGICSVPPGPLWEELHDMPVNGYAATLQSWKDSILNGSIQSFLPILLKLCYPVSAIELTTWSDLSPLGLTVIHRYLWSFAWIVMIPAIASIFLNWKQNDFRHTMKPFLILFFGFWIAQTLLVSSGRYRIPMMPAAFIFSAFFFCTLKKYQVRKTLLCLSVSAVLVCLGAIPVLNDNQNRTIHDFAASCLAESSLEAGDSDGAWKIISGCNLDNPLISERLKCVTASILIEIHEYEKAKDILLSSEHHEDKKVKIPVMILSSLGRIYEKTGDSARAEASYKAVLEKASGTLAATTSYNYGVLLESQERYEEALEMYRNALKMKPSMVPAISNQGVIAMMQNRFSDAQILFEKALTMDSSNPNRIVNLAAACYFGGKTDRAIRILRPLMESGHAPDHAVELWNELTGSLSNSSEQ